MQTYTHKHDLTWKTLMIIILCLISSSWERYVGLNSKLQIDIWYNVICNCDLVTIPLVATRMQIYTHEHDLTWRVLMISCLIFSSWEPYVWLHLKHQMDIWYNMVCNNEVFKISSIVIVPPSFTHALVDKMRRLFLYKVCLMSHCVVLTT